MASSTLRSSRVRPVSSPPPLQIVLLRTLQLVSPPCRQHIALHAALTALKQSVTSHTILVTTSAMNEVLTHTNPSILLLSSVAHLLHALLNISPIHTIPSLPLHLSLSVNTPAATPVLQALSSICKLQHRNILTQILPTLFPPLHQSLSHAPSRQITLSIFHSLALIPHLLTPFWSTLLPFKNSPTTLSHLAFHISHIPTRSIALSVLLALLSSSRTFLRNAANARPANTAFVSSSARVTHAIRELYPLTTEALQLETDGIVLAKISRLATELLSVATPPPVQPVSFRHLLSCLSARSRNTTTDRTARAAAASALSVGVANGAEFLNLAFVERLCRHVVCALDLHAQTFDVPRLEMLSVLRAVMAHTASLFPVVWPCVRDTLHHPIEDGVVLHAVRVVQTFMQCRLDELKQGKQLLQLEPMLICQVYDAMLSKFVALVHMHTVQISAIAAVDAAAQLLVATSMQRDLPLEICSQLQFVVLSQDVRSVVQVAAVRALGNVSITSHTNIYSLFMFLQRIIRSQKYHITVRSRAMASVSTLLNCVAQTTHGAGLRAFVSENGVFAARCLEHLDVLGGVHAAASAADRAGQEAAKVAAVNLLAACVCVLGVVRKENEESGDERRRMMEVLGVTLMKEEESVNTRCQCCKAICHIIDFQKKHDVMSLTDVVEGVLETIRRAVSWKQPVRLQIFAAKVMKDITGFSMSNTGRVGILQTCCACFHEHALALERCDAIERGREHIASLRDVLSEVVCIVFRDVERECVSELMDGVDERFADVVVECVARHLVLPIRMLREERGKWMEGGGSADCWGEGKGLQDLLTEEAKGIVEKVLLAVKVMKKT